MGGNKHMREIGFIKLSDARIIENTYAESSMFQFSSACGCEAIATGGKKLRISLRRLIL